MRKYSNLFALCCLALSGFACDSKDRAPQPATTGTRGFSCTPAIYYGCSASCDPGVKAWQLCADDGASYGACLCANPAPVSSPDASVPALTPDATVVTPPVPTPDAAASTGSTTIQVNVDINYPPPPDAGAAPVPSPTPTPPPVQKTCQSGSDFVSVGSMRPCGFVAGACRPGTQICNNSGWSECTGGTLPTSEVCDGVDNDCDGAIDNGLICECDPAKGPTRPCGGHGNRGACKAGTQSCVAVGTGFEWAKFCAGEVRPKPEACNLVDDDCDGVIDNGFNTGATCQGIGECGKGAIECNLQTNVAQCSTMPNGSNYHPVPELCDGKDNDCDGFIDEDFYVGAPCISPGVCSAFPGVYECSGLYAFTCSTGPKGSNSMATAEICSDFVDNNCDGVVNEGCDCKDGETQQCGPKNADGSVNQTGECRNTTIVCENGKWPIACSGAVYPSPELCDGKDNDCDGVADNGFDLGAVCQGIGECGAGMTECTADNKGTICSTLKGGSQYHPMPELCDGKDNDCDGLVDEDFFIGAPCIGMGACAATVGAYECDGLQSFKCSTGTLGSKSKATPEICNDLIDNDCNGIVNDGCKCTDGEKRLCGPTNADGSMNTNGICHSGEQVCANGVWPTACPGAINPTVEICDGLDNDCDGVKDDGFNIGTACTGVGECGTGKLECASATTTICSTMPGASLDKSKPETCDGKDNDCDGSIDETFFIGAPCNGIGACGAGKLECASVSTTRCSTMPGASQDQSKPEACDASMKDENCNGSVNEGCACTPGSPDIICGTSNVGECHYGSQSCLSNGTYATCVGAINPVPELCDGKDNDCDGTVDNGFNKQNDKNNCGVCGNVCSFANASSLCQAGVCTLSVCNANYFNFNGLAADGCETGCMPTRNGVEYCDGIDNNCDGIVDNATVAVQTDPMNCGACGHICALPNVATNGCASGACTVALCLPGYVDSNGIASDGCETKVVITSDAGTVD